MVYRVREGFPSSLEGRWGEKMRSRWTVDEDGGRGVEGSDLSIPPRPGFPGGKSFSALVMESKES